MTGKEKIEAMLRAFAERGIEPARLGLMREIKSRIPRRLIPHRIDTVRIIVDLRISRIAAAAVIVLALLLAGSFFGGREAISGGVVHDGKLLLKYTLGGESVYRSEISDTLARFREGLLAQGREVVSYGDAAELNDPHAILMHWKLDEDKYGIIFADLSAHTVSAKMLITLQAHMLEKRVE
ncbi:MAG: hypothetical protein JSW27_02630 [Phycisphaerales bacterium]|nr:MAG: hypothetical protein JSW27_02630 [Phycisphaerales bacterium]